MVLLVLASAGCSSDGGSDDAPDRTTSTTSTTAAPVSTTEAPTTTQAPASSTTVAPTPPGAGPTAYAGVVDGQEGATVRFTRDGGIEGFEVRGLSVTCQPLAATGDSKERTVSVTIDAAPLTADGSIDHTEETANLRPSLSGAFADDGTFTGGIFLTGEDDGFVCGGEFTFFASPA